MRGFNWRSKNWEKNIILKTVVSNEKRGILKSISIIGGGQVLSILSGMARIKVIAITLGTAGIGLFGLYQSLLDLFKTIFSFGLNLTVSREAAVVVKNNQDLSDLWPKVFSWIILGSIFSSVSLFIYYLFQDSLHLSLSIDIVYYFVFISLFCFTIFCTISQSFIQGGLGYKTFINISILSNLIGSICSILVIIFFKEEGVLPSLLIFWFVSFFVSYYFLKRNLDIKILKFKLILKDSKKMIFDGGFVLLATGSNAFNLFLIRDIVLQNYNEDGLGLVQAGLSISLVYISLIINSLAADYYPKLTACIQNSPKAIKLINNQTEILLFIGVIMMLGIGFFLKYMILMLYSSEFLGALNLTYWLIMSTFFRLIGYPLSYVALVKNEGIYYFLIEFMFNFIFFILVYFFIKKIGIEIIGIGVFVSYIFYTVLNFIYCVQRDLISYDFKLIVKIVSSFFIILSSFIVLRFELLINNLFFFIFLFLLTLLINYKLVFKDLLKLVK